MANHNTHLIVRNAKKTSGLKAQSASSWISYWRKETKSSRTRCARLGCSNVAKVGAHVKFVDRRRTRDLYIVPLCSKCNNWNNGDEIIIDSRTYAIEA